MAGLVEPQVRTQGILKVASNAEINRAQKEADEINNAAPAMVINNLQAYLNRQWQAAKSAKQQIDDRMVACLRQRNGVYDPAKLAMIREQGGSEIFLMLTNIKCRATESWINDVIFSSGENPWKLEPTPLPDLPGDVTNAIEQQVNAEADMAMQFALDNNMPPITPDQVASRIQDIKDEFMKRLKAEADRRSLAMSEKIEDQLVEAEWEEAVKEFIKDVVTYPAGILRGPVIRRTRTKEWKVKNGKWMPVITPKLKLHFYRVRPYDFYPSPNSRKIDDGYLFERHRLRRKDLLAMKGVPGYKNAAIDEVLTQYSLGGLRNWIHNDQIVADLEGRPNEWMAGDQTIDALEYNGSLPGKLLREWGMSEKEVPDVLQEYECNAWMIGPYVIRAVLNDDPLSRRNYHKASFEEVPGAFWGYGVPELMNDIQDICNATGRALVNNLAISSGPLVEVHNDRLAAGEDITQISPWRVLQTQSDPNGRGNSPAVHFYQPNINADVLLRVLDHFSRLADEHTGIPAYTYGTPEGGGAASTASGLSMLMSNSSRGIKQVVSHIDKPIEGTISLTYDYNMMYDEDDSIKGDIRIKATGSSSLIAKEQRQIRISEFLDKTNNPIDMSIMGQKGRAKVLREAVKVLDMVIDEVVPDDKDLMAQIREQAMAGAGMPQGAAPQTLDAAGNPVSGQDTALFTQRG